jgi:cytoskeletal protein CcmA (bactofilin family)
MADLSTIGRGTTIRGNIRGDGDLDVHGRVDGSVTVKGELSISETALVKSDVSARRVVVRGAVAGNVTADDSLVLEAGARVVGDLSAPRIGIRPGALLRGNVTTVGAENAPIRARAAAKPAAEPARAPARPATPAARPAATTHAPSPAPATRAPMPAARPQPQAAAAPPPRPAAANAASDGVKAPSREGPPPPVVPSLGRGAKASLKRKGAR